MKLSITFKTLPLEVEFDYIPGEEKVSNYGDGSGYPGNTPKIDIAYIYLSMFLEYIIYFDLTSFFEETGLIYQVEEELLRILAEQND